MNNALKLQSPWNEVKDKLKEHNIDLTDDDLDYQPGKEQELFERLGRKWHKSSDEIKTYIESISANKSQAG